MVRMFRNPTTLSGAGKQPDDPGPARRMVETAARGASVLSRLPVRTSGSPQRPVARFMNTAGSASHSA